MDAELRRGSKEPIKTEKNSDTNSKKNTESTVQRIEQLEKVIDKKYPTISKDKREGGEDKKQSNESTTITHSSHEKKPLQERDYFGGPPPPIPRKHPELPKNQKAKL